MNTHTRRKKRQTAAAGGLQSRQTQTQTCLPDDLTDQLPSCAFNCILDFTRENYSPIDCTSTSNLDFLCTRQTRSGTTIGEASLQCVASFCGNQATNQVLLAGYNICEDVDNAIQNTATVLNATIRPATPTATPTTQVLAGTSIQPASEVPPTPSASVTGLMAGGSGSRIISGDGMSVTMDVTMPSSTSTTGSIPSMTEMRSNFMPEESAGANPGLSQTATAGIAAGSGVAGLFLLALLVFFLRRRKKGKEQKTEWPKQISSPDTDNFQASSFGPSRPKEFPSNKRRSFWRVSIRPEEIGVAVSGKPGNRKSTSSEKSMLGKMPTIPAEHMTPRSSWPTPRGFTASPPPRPSRDSVATIFDEDIEQQPNQPPRVSVEGTFFALDEPTKPKRLRAPEPLKLNQTRAVSPSPFSSASLALPLTPTYDNGNFVGTPNSTAPPDSIDAALASTIPLSAQGQNFRDSPAVASPNTSPRRNRLLKKLNPRPSPPPSAAPARQDSSSTTFDTDTDLEEGEKRLEPRGRGPLSTIAQSPRTPLNDLQYPTVPESAAVSPQARSNANRRSAFKSPTPSFISKGLLPQRNTLLRNDSSFNKTDSTSSDGRESDYSIEWPVPPSGRPFNEALQGPTAPVSPLAKLENCANAESNYTQQRATQAQLHPESKARMIPAKSKTGDLFFKVEMQ